MNTSAGVMKIQERDRRSIRRRLVASGSVARPKRTPRMAAGTTVATMTSLRLPAPMSPHTPRAEEPADAEAA